MLIAASDENAMNLGQKQPNVKKHNGFIIMNIHNQRLIRLLYCVHTPCDCKLFRKVKPIRL